MCIFKIKKKLIKKADRIAKSKYFKLKQVKKFMSIFEVQMYNANNFLFLIDNSKGNSGQNSKLSSSIKEFLKDGQIKWSNMKGKSMMNYFIKIKNFYYESAENKIMSKQIQSIIDWMEILIDLIFPFAELIVNRFIRWYESPGFSISDIDKY